MIQHGLRLGFTGAGGTGKTTTAEHIQEALNIPFSKSASRIVYEARNLTEEKCYALSDKEKYELQFEIFNTKEILDKGQFAFVADRTLLDHWAYCLMYCGAFIPNDKYAEFEVRVREHMLTAYSHIFYFPFGYWFEKGDGVRQDHHSWQSAIDAIILGYIQRWDLPVMEVPQMEGRLGRYNAIMEDVTGELDNGALQG